MTPEITDLVAALTVLKRQIPGVCLAMTQGELSPAKQTEFGDLLIQLGQLLKQHTPTQIIEGHTEHTTSAIRSELAFGQPCIPSLLPAAAGQQHQPP